MKRARQNGHRHTCECGRSIRSGGPWTMHTRTCEPWQAKERQRETRLLRESVERFTADR